MTNNRVIPEAAVEAAELVLIAHQRRDNSSCLCGWAKLGLSHPLHQAQVALEAAAPYISAQALTEAIDAFPLETITAPDNAVMWLLRRADELSPRG